MLIYRQNNQSIKAEKLRIKYAVHICNISFSSYMYVVNYKICIKYIIKNHIWIQIADMQDM